MIKIGVLGILLGAAVQLTSCAAEMEAETCLVEFGYTYNANGHIEQMTLDENANGSVDARVEYKNTYTEDGWINQVETSCFRSDGRTKFTTIHDLNESGRTIFSLYSGEEIHVNIHEYGETISEEQSIFSYQLEYDSNNRLLSQTLDMNADNTPDERELYSYNEDGDKEKHEIDEGADGSIDSVTNYTYTFTEEGKRQSIIQEEIGLITTVTVITYGYDADGNTIARSTDVRHDGILDELCTVTYRADGKTDSCEGYVNGAPVWRRSEQRDVDGNVLIILYEEFDDGYASRRTNTYDESGNRITATFDRRDNAEASWRDTEHRTYTYDVNGKRETITRKLLNWGPSTQTCADSLLPRATITERR